MSLTHYEYFQVGKKFQPVIDETISSHKKFWRAINKVKKEVGAEALVSRTFGLERTINAFTFKTPPDLKVWRRVLKDQFKNAYWPRQNTVAGRELYARLHPLRTWNSAKLSQAVGYNWLHFGDRVFPFNGGFNQKTKTAYFCVPAIPPTEKKPKEWYEPVAGVKKISFKKYKELTGELS